MANPPEQTSTARAEASENPASSVDTLAASPKLKSGSVLADRYELIRPIGRGGMGSVWEARHSTLDTPVAVKLIHEERVDDEVTRGRFLREARAAAALRSPHVVQIFDYGVHQGTPYIAMELMSGESLAARLEREGPLGPAETLRLMTHVFRAVTKAHAAELVHRDLKPDNIFLVEGPDGGTAKVLDFGIAKGLKPGQRLDATTQTGAVLGTPFYMSPEQLLDSGKIDTRSDLWSLAVIVYECLIGKRPFEASSVPELAVQLWSGDPVIPSQRAEVPPGFDSWFATATARDPDLRHMDAQAMLSELETVLGGGSPLGVGADARPPRRGLFVGALGGVVVSLVVIFAVRGGSDDPPHDDAKPTPSVNTESEPIAASPPDTEGFPPVRDSEPALPATDTETETADAETVTSSKPKKRTKKRPSAKQDPEGFDVNELEF